MTVKPSIIKEIPGLYRIIPLRVFRRTPGVFFDLVPMELLPRIDGIDRVIHEHGALSPGPLGNVDHPWYMHCYQEDNLLVLHGTRYVDIYTQKHGKVERFIVSTDMVKHNDDVIFNGPSMLVWPCGVFHRIRSGETGSASLNFAVRHEGFDIRTNFSIYDLDTESGEFRMIREGHLDQY